MLKRLMARNKELQMPGNQIIYYQCHFSMQVLPYPLGGIKIVCMIGEELERQRLLLQYSWQEIHVGVAFLVRDIAFQ